MQNIVKIHELHSVNKGETISALHAFGQKFAKLIRHGKYSYIERRATSRWRAQCKLYRGNVRAQCKMAPFLP